MDYHASAKITVNFGILSQTHAKINAILTNNGLITNVIAFLPPIGIIKSA
jgi:hypothetical protein